MIAPFEKDKKLKFETLFLFYVIFIRPDVTLESD